MKRLLIAMLFMLATNAQAGWITLDVEGFLIMFELPDAASFVDLSTGELLTPLDTSTALPEFVTMAALAPDTSTVPEVQVLPFALAGLVCLYLARRRLK
jgi:hypothetical protein